MPCWNILPGRIPSFSTYLNIRNPFSHLSKCSLVFGVLLGLFKITEVSAPGPANSVDSGGVEYYDGDEIDEKAGHQVDPYAPGSSVPLAPLRVTQPFCSFFDNRSPQMQPDLRNCTWYRERSCCRQAELESIFKKVKPLQGASENCMRHLNYMICWVCDPLQYNFYSNGWRRLKMCASFCDAVLNACKDAKLKGDYVGVLYPTGAEFCKSRRFDVALNDKDCFSYNGRMPRSDPRWGPSSNAGPDLESFSYLFMLFLCIQFYHRRNVLL